MSSSIAGITVSFWLANHPEMSAQQSTVSGQLSEVSAPCSQLRLITCITRCVSICRYIPARSSRDFHIWRA